MEMAELTKFRVVLPVEVGGRVYQHGEVLALDEATAEGYLHALRAVDVVDAGEEEGK